MNCRPENTEPMRPPVEQVSHAMALRHGVCIPRSTTSHRSELWSGFRKMPRIAETADSVRERKPLTSDASRFVEGQKMLRRPLCFMTHMRVPLN
jgi:hypothetical protein